MVQSLAAVSRHGKPQSSFGFLHWAVIRMILWIHRVWGGCVFVNKRTLRLRLNSVYMLLHYCFKQVLACLAISYLQYSSNIQLTLYNIVWGYVTRITVQEWNIHPECQSLGLRLQLCFNLQLVWQIQPGFSQQKSLVNVTPLSRILFSCKREPYCLKYKNIKA